MAGRSPTRRQTVTANGNAECERRRVRLIAGALR